MAILLRIVGWVIMACGLIAGIVLANTTTTHQIDKILKDAGFKAVSSSSFEWSIFFTYLIGGVISGLVFLGLSVLITRAEENQAYLHELLVRLPKEKEEHKPLGTSRADLGKIGDYKMKAMD